ncbi:MAG TPA: carboxypeptidase regulatory-like domain-containing protein [Thermoanaerobaculia bacterium]|nr:carboxypeptidase regulatory-like domain-containing protein [Thermoanaerobaculia bacterium]
MKFSRFLAVLAMMILASVSVFAQSSVTGVLTGTVTSDGAPLPGATVTATSPQLQGSRTSTSDANGNYNIAALPPGEYTVRVELQGLQTVTRTTRVTLSGTARVDADLKVSAVTESITVTASAPAVMETTEVQTNYQKEQIDNLPVGRTVTAIALLSPGVTANGPRAAVQISGSFANDNLIVVNGANVQENLRGQARPLFIEDAIQETTVITGAVSAEFGRFTGGVISSITKSGGNEFSGSLRDSLTKPAWTASSEAGEDTDTGDLSHTYEGTLGGRIIRDRLWFFGAGRLSEIAGNSGNFILTGESIPSVTENTRYEVKLTGQVTPNHSLMVNYLDNPLTATNNNQLGMYEASGLDPEIEQEEDFKAARYSGIFTNNLLGEVNYSERTFVFVGFGGTNRDIYAGTPLVQFAGGRGVANAPYFCGVCDDEHRDNELLTAKLTYFLGTKSLGTHNIVGGYEDFNEFRLSNNYQSPTNLTVWIYGQQARLVGGQHIYTFSAGDTVEYYPVQIPSIGSDLTTRSLFFNDKWDLNSNFSFNLGGRYDQTEAVDQQGNATADDSQFSPRLGATYDILGNGRFKVNASYAKYVGRLAETVQGAGSAAGSPWGIYYYYTDSTPITGTASEVIRGVIDWFNANGGTDFANWQGDEPPSLHIGGVSTKLAGKLKSPGVDEWTLGGGVQLTPNAYVRADYINREWNNYYGAITNQSTGAVIEPITGAPSDLTLITNTDLLTREYRAVQLSANSRFFNRLSIGGNYTWSELTGNAEGEGTAGGPQADGGWILQYPEFQGFAQNRPHGFLSGDQTHKLRVWAGMDFPLGPAGVLNVSLLQRFDSGTPFNVAFAAVSQADPNATNVVNPGENPTPGRFGYWSRPTTVSYFVEERGSRRWDDITATDLAVNYRLPISVVQLFVEGELINAFNEQGQIAGVTTVSRTGTVFNPFTTTPVAGTHYNLAANFGAARNAADYQLARTYRVSLGVRF